MPSIKLFNIYYIIYNNINGDVDVSGRIIGGCLDVLVNITGTKYDCTKDFINRYKEQLNIYKRAIQVIYNKQVEKTYIYSFKLDKMIEVKN